MLKYLAAAGIASLLLWPLGVPASPAWEQWQSVGGVFDLGGPRADGALVVAASGALYTLTSAGVLTRFAVAYHDDPGAEAYLAMSPGISAPACAFAPDDLFILRLHAPIGVTHVNADGTLTSPFTNVGASSLNGIAFDSVGGFSHDLLVTAPVNGKTEVAGIDCSGGVRVITRSAPVVEGGIAVAPQGFGQFGGDLIAPDELSGLIWAIAPDGSSKQVVNSGLPHGQDTGVESVAFVPAGFIGRGGFLYYSDRLTTGNPHPGSDHVLRLSSVDLVASGVQDGDLLAATEGGASMIDVRCAATCGVTRIVATPTTAHGEGHLVFAVSPVPASSPSARSVNQTRTPASGRSVPVGAYAALLAAIIAAMAAVFAAVAARRRRP